MGEAVRRVGGAEAYTKIQWEPDPLIQQIISGWPRALAAPRAVALGFTVDNGIDEVVEAFVEDDLDMQKRLAKA
jgi:D-erythronate 2-dehydrogenase